MKCHQLSIGVSLMELWVRFLIMGFNYQGVEKMLMLMG